MKEEQAEGVRDQSAGRENIWTQGKWKYKSTDKVIQNELYYLYSSRNIIWVIMGLWRKMKISMHVARMMETWNT
jgi:hypothetical protein